MPAQPPPTAEDEPDPAHSAGSDETALSIHLTHGADGDPLVMRLAGDIDTLTSTKVWEEVQHAVLHAEPGTMVIIDLTGVAFLDSFGITTLLNLYQQARRAQVTLRVVAEPAQFARRVLQLAGADQILPIYDSVGQAGAGSTS